MTDLERVWFEAGRRARRELGLVAPPSFYALLAAAVRRATNGNETPVAAPGSRTSCSSLTTTTPDPHPANPQGEDRAQA